jgi:cyclic-di-GMP-binding protein
MPSFDIVSKIDLHELTNAVDQANREVETRFDFKGTNAKFIYAEDKITLSAPNKFQLEQMLAILQNKFAKRSIDIRCLEYEKIEESLHEARQVAKIHQGIDQEIAKQITKLIKDSKIKVQAAIMGDHIRVTGKKRDDLQEVIALLRKEQFTIPLQFENFRD